MSPPSIGPQQPLPPSPQDSPVGGSFFTPRSETTSDANPQQRNQTQIFSSKISEQADKFSSEAPEIKPDLLLQTPEEFRPPITQMTPEMVETLSGPDALDKQAPNSTETKSIKSEWADNIREIETLYQSRETSKGTGVISEMFPKARSMILGEHARQHCSELQEYLETKNLRKRFKQH